MVEPSFLSEAMGNMIISLFIIVGLVIAVIIIKWINSSNKKINETSKSYDLLKRR